MGRLGVLVGMIVLFVVLPLGRQAVELYTDWLWFQEVGFPGVFATIVGSAATAPATMTKEMSSFRSGRPRCRDRERV